MKKQPDHKSIDQEIEAMEEGIKRVKARLASCKEKLSRLQASLDKKIAKNETQSSTPPPGPSD